MKQIVNFILGAFMFCMSILAIGTVAYLAYQVIKALHN